MNHLLYHLYHGPWRSYHPERQNSLPRRPRMIEPKLSTVGPEIERLHDVVSPQGGRPRGWSKGVLKQKWLWGYRSSEAAPV